jgi:hypothetical protein
VQSLQNEVWGMKIREYIRKNKKYNYNYPIKSGLLIGDVIILCVSFLTLGIVLSDKELDILGKSTFLIIAISYIIIATINFYFSSYKTLRNYENEHGSTKKGDKYDR